MAVHKLLQYPSIIACLDVDNYVSPIREDQGFLVAVKARIHIPTI